MFMRINPGAFVDNLYYMGVGMLSIFIVIGVIILATLILDRGMKALEKNKKM